MIYEGLDIAPPRVGKNMSLVMQIWLNLQKKNQLTMFKHSQKFICRLEKYNAFFKLRFTPCKVEQPLQGMELQEKETQEG